MKQHNQVLSKLGRAGLVGLFATALAFAGIAPANAMSGGGFQTSDLGTNGTAVAHIAVPDGKGDKWKYKNCTGVLIKPDMVLTSSDCFALSNDPYTDVFGRKSDEKMDTLATKTARITFGKNSQDNTKAQNRVYFSVRAETPADTKWGISVIQLDRPVEGVTPAQKAPKVVQGGQKVKLLGWETTDFVPSPGAIPATINTTDKQVAFRAVGEYQSSPMTWENFLKTNKSIPELDMPNADDKDKIVPAFKIDGWHPSRDKNSELGAPVLTDDGKLQGLLVGYSAAGMPVFMDTGEADVSDWIYREHTQAKPNRKSKPVGIKELTEQFEELRGMLCSKVEESSVGKYADYAKSNRKTAEIRVSSHNSAVKDDTKYVYSFEDGKIAPSYGDVAGKDPGYIKDLSSKDATKLPAICESKPGTDMVDMLTMYKKAIELRGPEDIKLKAGNPAECESHTLSYNCERLKLTTKIDEAKDKYNIAKQKLSTAEREEKQAFEMQKINPADEDLKKKYDGAREENKKAKNAADAANREYRSQLALQESIIKGLDPVINDAVTSITAGLLDVTSKVETAQNAWMNEDDAFRKSFEDALDKYLLNQQAKYENTLIEAENKDTNNCREDKGKIECKPGYPKPLKPVDASLKDPRSEFLAKNGGKDKVKRNLDAYFESLNQSVPILLEARYQIWNMNRMIALLQKGGKLDDSEKISYQEEIMKMLDQQEKLRAAISTANGHMREKKTKLEELYNGLAQSLKEALNKKGYPKAIENYNNAKEGFKGTNTDMANLDGVRNELHDATTGEDYKRLLETASKAYHNLNDVLASINNSVSEMQDLLSYGELMKDRLVKPDADKDDPTKGMTPEQKEKYLKEKAEKERKEKEEAEKKTEESKKAEEEKKKADDEAKKDEARLAKALSKNTLRAEGTDRVLTSIAAWKIGKFPGDSLVLVDGNVHADGLSATPFAAALKAPVLLTCWKTGLEPALMDQIKASGKKKLFLVGGQVPMTPYDEFELRDAGLDIFRIAGPDRYATSVAVNQATEPLIGAKPKKPINLYIGDGVGFPDALVAGAAAGRVGGLMLLSKGKQLDAQTYNYISNLGQTRPLKIIPVGGSATAAVKNTPWPTTMSINIAPIVGKDRYETAAKLATTLPGTRAAVLATGENFADALSGGSLAVDQNATLVLTRSQELPPASYQSLQRFGSEKTIVMGGKSAVSPKVAELINGATLKNTDTKTVLGTLLERKKLRDEKANQEAKERRNALSTVKGMIKDSNSLKDVMSQLGFGSIDDLTKLLNDFKAQQDKDKKPDTAKPELDKSSTTTGK